MVYASPHSGRDYTATFQGKSNLNSLQIRSSEDAFVDELYADAPETGAPLIVARAPRAFIDLNRSVDELDPALIEGAPPQRHNPRIASGLGVIPRVVSGGRAIYHGKIPLSEANRRVGKWWRPYHDRLQRLLDESQLFFGPAILIDCHSMPHEALAGLVRNGGPKADVVLGDRFGASAAADLVDRVEAAFVAEGLSVARNTPFAGAFVTQHYGRPKRNQHVIQIEIDRALYLDETTIERSADFDEFRRVMSRVVNQISDIGRRPNRMAAE